MNNPLKKITALAKAIKKRFPTKHDKWTDYVKEASKLIKTKEGRKQLNARMNKTSEKVNDIVAEAIVKKYLGSRKKATKKRTIKKKANARHFLKGTDTEKIHKDVKSHNLKINFFSGLKKIKGEAHKSKYYITYKRHGIEHIEYYNKLPKGYYKGMDRILYIQTWDDVGTILTPIKYTKNNLPVKK